MPRPILHVFQRTGFMSGYNEVAPRHIMVPTFNDTIKLLADLGRSFDVDALSAEEKRERAVSWVHATMAIEEPDVTIDDVRDALTA